MFMSILWTGLVLVSILYGAATGTADAVGAAVMTGAEDAVRFVLGMGGAICLWCGVARVMEDCGMAAALSAMLRPVLRRLFPSASRDAEIMDALSANIGANLLGLGNAATPMGVRAAQGMARHADGKASNELCLLVLINTASIQLLPTTVAALRSACGARCPFDILPAVWLATAVSLASGLLAARLFARFWP